MTNIKLLVVSLLACVAVQDVAGHGLLIDPPARSSVWRHNSFSELEPPVNYNDMELFCGGLPTMIANGGRCGECGDNWSLPRPRDNEEGGYYYRGIITGRYKESQEITVKVDLTANHLGHFEFRLCAKSSPTELVQQECLDQNVLQLADGSGTKFPIIEHQIGMIEVRLRLPAGLTCEQCVLQWHYRAGNSVGECDDGTEAHGCGPQETFRGCADIAISH